MLFVPKQSRSSSDISRSASLPIPSERDFYERYDWSLNPHLRFREAVDYLADQLPPLGAAHPDWQRREMTINVYLLSCALLNGVDEQLRGGGLRLPAKLARTRLGAAARWTKEHMRRPKMSSGQGSLRAWRKEWASALVAFLRASLAGAGSPEKFERARVQLRDLLQRAKFPAALANSYVSIPSPFRRLDLSHEDVIALGERYMSVAPERSERLLLVGLRTSGSYFAPLLTALFQERGYSTVDQLTVAPSKGAGKSELQQLRQYARKGYRALVLDDPPHTGGAITTGLNLLLDAGFDQGKIKLLVPIHPARRSALRNIPPDSVITLKPEVWYKCTLLSNARAVEDIFKEYFKVGDVVSVSIEDSERARRINSGLDSRSEDRGSRLKKVFDVKLTHVSGVEEHRLVLAKSVGWGWFAYHAFFIAAALPGFIPQLIGLRYGILFMEWIEDATPLKSNTVSSAHLEKAASYIAARTNELGLLLDRSKPFSPPRQNNATSLLRDALAKSQGRFPVNLLSRKSVERLLSTTPRQTPVVIDGNMTLADWLITAEGLVKLDYEHHGLGKEELNIVDSAYDLADLVLHWELSRDQERALIRGYVRQTADLGVEQRLFLMKMTAALWSMKRSHERMSSKSIGREALNELHCQFMRAWDFATVQTARHCGRLCSTKPQPAWRSPAVLMDIDGVLDRRLFGFPSTSAAGIQALSLLHEHNFCLAVNTARSVAEVKAYCEAYSLAGGIAEHGAYIWDAVKQEGKRLISEEACDQLSALREHLRKVPGVFLDDRHQFSIRAFTYKEKPQGTKEKLLQYLTSGGFGDGLLKPLPAFLIQQLIAELQLDLLSFHQTSIDSTVTAKDADKGTGLVNLRNWVLGEQAETIAIGDQEPDLRAFAMATRSFAPRNVGCPAEAKLFGTHILRHSFQRGLLEMACILTNTPINRAASTFADAGGADVFTEILTGTDRSWRANLLRSVIA